MCMVTCLVRIPKSSDDMCCAALTISITEFQSSQNSQIRTSLAEAFAQFAELDLSLISLLSVAEVTGDSVRRGLLWRRTTASVKAAFEARGVVASTLGSSMADTGEGGYAQIVTEKLLVQGISLAYSISVVVSQDSLISFQLGVKSAGASAVGNTMSTCMANAQTGISTAS